MEFDFYLLVQRCYRLWRWSPTATCVLLLGQLRRLRSRRWMRLFGFGAGIRPATSSADARCASKPCSRPLGGDSAVPRAASPPAPIIIRLRPRSKSAAPAPAASWRIRWRRRRAHLQWMAWVAQNLYDESPYVSLRGPAPPASTQRRHRLSLVRPSRSAADRAES